MVRFDERKDIVWRHDPTTGNSQRNFAPALLRKEVETCGLCHARRGEFSEDWVPGRWLSDTHAVSPLARGLYEADGQMRDEVYNYGSFKQSKMFAAGVTCSDCHEPHSGKLRASGDGVCLQCHAPEKYAAASHHRHAEVNPPLACASCHMPTRTYMVVDRRHDHSFRIPRPDLSASLGTPNACNDCHADKSAQWAAAAIESWHGGERKGFQKYAQAFHAAWADQADAAALLSAVAADRNYAGFRPRRRSDRARIPPIAREHQSRAQRACRSRPDGAHRRPRHAGQRSGGPALAGGLAAPLRCKPRRAHQSRRAACRRSDREPAGRRSRALRAGRRRIRCRPAPQCRPAGGARDAGQFSRPSRPHRRGGGGVQGCIAAQSAICGRGDQPRRSLSSEQSRCRGGERAARRDHRFAAGCGPASRARARAHPSQAARRCTCRAAARGRARAGAGEICLTSMRSRCIQPGAAARP